MPISKQTKRDSPMCPISCFTLENQHAGLMLLTLGEWDGFFITCYTRVLFPPVLSWALCRFSQRKPRGHNQQPTRFSISDLTTCVLRSTAQLKQLFHECMPSKSALGRGPLVFLWRVSSLKKLPPGWFGITAVLQPLSLLWGWLDFIKVTIEQNISGMTALWFCSNCD